MVFSTLLGNFLPFSLNSKLLSANSFCLEESKNCCLGKGLKMLLELYQRNLIFNSTEDLKTMLKKEKLLVPRILSSFNHVFYFCKEQTNNSSYIYFIVCKCYENGSVFTLYHTILTSNDPEKKSF